MTVTDLLQVVPTRLIQDVCNKLLQACCHQLVNNLLRADDIRLVGTTCCESVGLINLNCYKMITTCSRLVNNWEQAVRTHLVDKLWDFNKLRPFSKNAQVVTGLQAICYKSGSQAVDKLSSHCLFPVVVTSLEQAVNIFQQAWWHYQTCYKVVLLLLVFINHLIKIHIKFTYLENCNIEAT
jgi:hypothetical protein